MPVCLSGVGVYLGTPEGSPKKDKEEDMEAVELDTVDV